jgi:hypothetical protein
MLSKILAVALTAVVLTVGAYAYWQYADGNHCCSTSTAPSNTVNTTPPCCQEPSRTSAEFSCCSSGESVCTPEVLTVAPREVE